MTTYFGRNDYFAVPCRHVPKQIALNIKNQTNIATYSRSTGAGFYYNWIVYSTLKTC